MANLENLMPIQEVNSNRTREQHSADSRRAGIASGEARRRRKTLKEELLLLLEEGDTQKNVSVALLNKVLSGDVQAFNTLRDTIGEKPVDKVEASVAANIVVDVEDE